MSYPLPFPLPYSHPAMTITFLTPDSRTPGDVIVDVDGRRFASLPIETVQALGLRAGQDLDGEFGGRVRRAVDGEAAYQVSVRLLATRPRAANELLHKLRDRGHDPQAAAEALGRLEVKGIINDEVYAQHFVRVRADRGHGPGRLLTDLLARGVDRRVAERAIAAVSSAEGVDSLVQARALAEKRAAQTQGLPPTTRRRRLLAFLARRGYRGREMGDLVAEVIRAS